MLRRIAAYLLLIFVIMLSFPYVFDDLLVLYFALFGVAAYTMLATAWPPLRSWRLTRGLRVAGTTLTPVVLILWLTSIIAYIRVPHAKGEAFALGNGSFILHSGVSTAGTPLTLQAQWHWAGLTAGEFSTQSATWTGGVTATSRCFAIWPMLVSLAIVTVILWLLIPKRIPPGYCQKCGYDLTGNVSGICPECGTPIKSEGETA